METEFSGKRFENCEVAIDDKSFSDCTFENVVLAYSGGEPPSITGCSFNKISIRFYGAAARTTALLQTMANPASGFRDIVKDTFPGLVGH